MYDLSKKKKNITNYHLEIIVYSCEKLQNITKVCYGPPSFNFECFRHAFAVQGEQSNS